MNRVKRPVPPQRRTAPMAEEVASMSTTSGPIPLNAYVRFTINYADGRGEHAECGWVVGLGDRLMVACDDIHNGDRMISVNSDHVLEWWPSKEAAIANILPSPPTNPLQTIQAITRGQHAAIHRGSEDPAPTRKETPRIEGGYLLNGYVVPFGWNAQRDPDSVALEALDMLYSDPMEAEILGFAQVEKCLWQTPEHICVAESGYYLMSVQSGKNYAAQLVYVSGMDKVYLGETAQVPVLRVVEELILHPDEAQRGRELTALKKGFKWGMMH